MKTILRHLLPAFAVLFFCTVATAQSLEELVTMQSDLQNFITVSTAKINNPNATASMTPQEIAVFQSEITAAQGKLADINPRIQELYAVEMRAKQDLQAADLQAAELAKKQQIAQQQQNLLNNPMIENTNGRAEPPVSPK